MGTRKQAGIFVPIGRRVWPHEKYVAEILAEAGHYVEFLSEGTMPTPDIRVDGNITYEIKSPESFNTNTMEHTIRKAVKQSPNIIISMWRLRKVRTENMKMFLAGQVRRSKQIKRMILITKSGEIVDISRPG